MNMKRCGLPLLAATVAGCCFFCSESEAESEVAAKPAPSFEMPTNAAQLAACTLPDKAYVIDYWTPPVDMIPAKAIRDYTLNTRVPGYHWLKYDGAYALVLKIHPIEKAYVEKEIETELIDAKAKDKALAFSLGAEKDAANRTVGIYNLDLDATEFNGLAFKVRAKARNAGDRLECTVAGKGFSATLDDDAKGKAAKEGFVDYRLPFKAQKGARIDRITFTVPAAEAADFQQEFEIIDFRLTRPSAQPRFRDLPPRTWVRKEGLVPVGDVYAYVRGAGATNSIAALPNTYELRPQLKDESDGGFKVEYVKAKVGGETLPAVKITLEKGPRCLLRFPIAFDGLDYNTMTFLAKVEVFDGAKPTLGDDKPMLWGTNQTFLNKPFDTFQVSFFSKTDDFCDWTRWGLAQADYCQNKDMSCAASQGKDGWRAFAYDIANSDPSNNKSSFYTKLSHWCFYYDNKKIPAGKKVTITIADPRLTKGLMLTGGDMVKYAAFLKTHDNAKFVDADALKSALEAPKTCRLAKPIRFVANHRAQGKIYQLPAKFPAGTSAEGAAEYTKMLTAAVDEFRRVVGERYGVSEPIPVEHALPGGVKNSIIVGGDAYAKLGSAQRKTYEADMKKLSKKAGFAIRADGSNLYVYAPADYNYMGDARPLAFALYELLENNTDLIYFSGKTGGGYGSDVAWSASRVFAKDPSGNFDIVWGDGFVHAPPVPEGNMSGPVENRLPGFNWVGSWSGGQHRLRSVNHWWGYGTEPHGNEKPNEPNETWGIDENGKKMKPDCYTGHPCLIRVLDRARDTYVKESAFAQRRDFAATQPKGKAFAWKCFDINGLWVEDSISTCQCPECLTAIRLADGSLVDRHSPYFRSTQFYMHGSAMINAVNVYGKRDALVESIAYFWMAPVPLMTPSRNYEVRFCPYIRKNYFVPIFAPMNDMHWRAMNAWGQMDVSLSIYEYFLYVNLRPWNDVSVYDFREETKLGGFFDWHAEVENNALCRMERWVQERMIWGSMGDDVAKLRGYFLKRTYREAADAMAKFYRTVFACTWNNLAFASPMEFEDDQIVYRNAKRTKGKTAPTVADELEAYLAEAEKEVKDPGAATELKQFRKEWDAYKKAAAATEQTWLEDVKGGASSKPMKIVGAPD